MVMKVHVYDMVCRIGTFESLKCGGAHYSQIDDENSWEIQPAHSMAYGLGVSMLVNFGPPSVVGVPKVTFFAAGADFEV